LQLLTLPVPRERHGYQFPFDTWVFLANRHSDVIFCSTLLARISRSTFCRIEHGVKDAVLHHHLKQVAGKFGLVHAESFRVFAQQ
jgi:hypothetical protein